MLPKPPPTRAKIVEDVLHGVTIADPYRWLEDSDSPETQAWTEAQNAHTRALLDGLPFRERIRARLDELWSVGLLGVCWVCGDRYFFLRREARQDQTVLYLRRGPDGTDEALVDPNVMGGEHLVTIDWWYPSRDGRLIAYGLSRGGDEMSTLHVMDVDSRTVLEDRIPDTRFSTVAWLPDGSGFYYTRSPAKGTVPPGQERYNKRVRFHRLGADPQDDPIVFGEGLEPTHMPAVSISRDGRWLLVHVQQGWAKVSLHVQDRERAERGFARVGEDVEAIHHGQVEDGRLFLHTNLDAPNWRILELDPAAPDPAEARTLIAERGDVVIHGLALVGGRLCVGELENASERLRVYRDDGTLERDVPLPGPGSLQGVGGWWGAGGDWRRGDLMATFTSFLATPRILRCDLASGRVSTFTALPDPPGFDVSAYEVTREQATSKDGTRVTIFVVHRKALQRDGSAPAVLYGYGGFNVNMTPYYMPTLPLWVESGGVYAIAVLRGGGELGEAWHRAGMLERKQNVFDDFLAAADRLVEVGWTSRERLGVYGGSNGGLLTGATITQRPDVCRAAVSAVPLLDMLRYQNFQIARLWIAEYGSSEDPEQFRWLLRYSPYHNVRHGERYPAVLFTTALGDTRVDPMHARKMAALMQSASGSERPVLVRVETAAGHGQGKPRWKQIEETADVWSFFFWQLGVGVQAGAPGRVAVAGAPRRGAGLRPHHPGRLRAGVLAGAGALHAVVLVRARGEPAGDLLGLRGRRPLPGGHVPRLAALDHEHRGAHRRGGDAAGAGGGGAPGRAGLRGDGGRSRRGLDVQRLVLAPRPARIHRRQRLGAAAILQDHQLRLRRQRGTGHRQLWHRRHLAHAHLLEEAAEDVRLLAVRLERHGDHDLGLQLVHDIGGDRGGEIDVRAADRDEQHVDRAQALQLRLDHGMPEVAEVADGHAVHAHHEYRVLAALLALLVVVE